MKLLSSLCRNGMICSWKKSVPTIRQFAASHSPISQSNCYPHSATPLRLFSSSSSNLDDLANTLATKLDWTDRIGLQDRFSLTEKGWLVDVDWRSTPHGAGLFTIQDIPAGTLMRKGILGVNLKEFESIQDIEDFCNLGDNDEYTPRIEYVKDYLWGFSKNADEKGYVTNPSQSSSVDDRFFGMWIPGNGLNHNEVPNTVYVATEEGIDLVALVDIRADDELFDDYRRHGSSSPWLKEFANLHNVTLNFADCNEFV